MHRSKETSIVNTVVCGVMRDFLQPVHLICLSFTYNRNKMLSPSGTYWSSNVLSRTDHTFAEWATIKFPPYLFLATFQTGLHGRILAASNASALAICLLCHVVSGVLYIPSSADIHRLYSPYPSLTQASHTPTNQWRVSQHHVSCCFPSPLFVSV